MHGRHAGEPEQASPAAAPAAAPLALAASGPTAGGTQEDPLYPPLTASLASQQATAAPGAATAAAPILAPSYPPADGPYPYADWSAAAIPGSFVTPVGTPSRRRRLSEDGAPAMVAPGADASISPRRIGPSPMQRWAQSGAPQRLLRARDEAVRVRLPQPTQPDQAPLWELLVLQAANAVAPGGDAPEDGVEQISLAYAPAPDASSGPQGAPMAAPDLAPGPDASSGMPDAPMAALALAPAPDASSGMPGAPMAAPDLAPAPDASSGMPGAPMAAPALASVPDASSGMPDAPMAAPVTAPAVAGAELDAPAQLEGQPDFEGRHLLLEGQLVMPTATQPDQDPVWEVLLAAVDAAADAPNTAPPAAESPSLASAAVPSAAAPPVAAAAPGQAPASFRRRLAQEVEADLVPSTGSSGSSVGLLNWEASKDAPRTPAGPAADGGFQELPSRYTNVPPRGAGVNGNTAQARQAGRLLPATFPCVACWCCMCWCCMRSMQRLYCIRFGAVNQ